MRTGLAVIIALLLALVPIAAATEPTGRSAEQINEFYDSGAWNRAIVKQVKKAKAYLKKRTSARNAPRKPALVLDIDETALDNYPCFVARGGIPYSGSVNAQCVTAYDAPAIKPVRSLFKRARELKVAVFFVTGRPEPLRDGSLDNLRAAGYKGKIELFMRPVEYEEESAVPAKRASRRAITRRGFKILANVGDQQSDLKGGFSERTYKLPNPIYVTP
jgi:predicted secreted acid phosphatase